MSQGQSVGGRIEPNPELGRNIFTIYLTRASYQLNITKLGEWEVVVSLTSEFILGTRPKKQRVGCVGTGNTNISEGFMLLKLFLGV